MILETLKQLRASRHDELESWFLQKRREHAPFFTTSVDLRHSGLRLAPVDTNLFPAGFNNLSPAARGRASRAIANVFSENFPTAKRVVLIPENHTRNLSYLENLATILALFAPLSLEVRLGSLAATNTPITLETPSGVTLVQYPLVRSGAQLQLADGFTPDVIVMNNDMTSGLPEILIDLAQPVIPPTQMGWFRRRKTIHFAAYEAMAQAFATQFVIDPWLISPVFHRCGMVDFKERSGLDCLANGVEKVLTRARERHKHYGISEAPYVFIKADSGTYGMGIMTVHSGEEVFEMNKKDRNKMQVIKEGARVSEVIIQEGIPTLDRVDGKPAEPMVYMIDGIPVGGMFRVNGARDALGNLNASGMEFTGMCDELEESGTTWKPVQNCHFDAYGIIAALAALAAAREESIFKGSALCA